LERGRVTDFWVTWEDWVSGWYFIKRIKINGGTDESEKYDNEDGERDFEEEGLFF
jgi:hypothetical protein